MTQLATSAKLLPTAARLSLAWHRPYVGFTAHASTAGIGTTKSLPFM